MQKVKFSTKTEKFWNTAWTKLSGKEAYFYGLVPPSEWNKRPAMIEIYGKNNGIDSFVSLVKDNMDSQDELCPKLAEYIGLPANTNIIKYLSSGSGMFNDLHFKRYGNWRSALYDIYEEMYKQFKK